ncbi:hypothetical protein [Pseudonocardia alaniniphila]|uniref:Uncharacterized protein n=1 Tax=Pseudonocardia alaniniphila TaxID=75291 RepID=A0ABS9TMZ5_9PSEU|nr:hypothetical protein [Pseudonocardia alaniniphila]MCH6169902.1 hypothetical protein [Pseudonocardia alaniniphila]
MSFVFFLVALLSSAVIEWWANLQRKRAKFLLRGVQAMLVDDRGHRPRYWWSPLALFEAARAEEALYQSVLRPTVGQAAESDLVRVMAHPLLRARRQSGPDGRYTRLPSYLPAADVATALVDVLLGGVTDGRIEERIAGLDSPALARSLAGLWKRAQGDPGQFLTAIEHWYESQMERVSGWYKRWTKRGIVVVGVLIAIAFNVDSVRIATALYGDGIVREAVAQVAGNPAMCGTPTPAPTGGALAANPPGEGEEIAGSGAADCARGVLEQLDAVGLPVGWPAGCPLDLAACVREPGVSTAAAPGVTDWLAAALGLAFTAVAAAFGAPFWFDVLNRLGSLRNNGTKPKPARR